MNNFLINRNMDLSDSDHLLDKLISDYDETSMPLPDIEAEPHLLISKVRKYYLEYVIRLLSDNYENNQKLRNKNIYLPSAIWRCAKLIEMNAAQTCMATQLYRKNIVAEIKQLKSDTQNGKLFRKLYDCLRKPPQNEKNSQTIPINTYECMCQCACNSRKKRRKMSESPKLNKSDNSSVINTENQLNISHPIFNIPVIENLHVDSPQMAQEKILANEQTAQTQTPPNNLSMLKETDNLSLKPSTRMSIESQDSDELMLQLEKLFQGESQEDDIFEGGLYSILHDDTGKKNTPSEIPSAPISESVIESHAAQIKSLDERLASLTGLLVNNHDINVLQEKPEVTEETSRTKKHNSSKWVCEEYFLKVKLFELLDEIGDTNRKKLARTKLCLANNTNTTKKNSQIGQIKQMLVNLFGDDSDEEVMSPLEETREFVISCKERIAPWVVKLLTPYFRKGRIQGKALFKALAKHLIRLIYQCSRYPHEYEVHSFVSDFLENHKMIRCEADFMQFRIENL